MIVLHLYFFLYKLLTEWGKCNKIQKWTIKKAHIKKSMIRTLKVTLFLGRLRN